MISAMDAHATVTYHREDALGYVTLSRPDVLNGMNDRLLADVSAALGEAHADALARAVILRGAGRVFCAGADMKEDPPRRTLDEYRRDRLHSEREIARAVRRLTKPLIASIHGAAMGGGLVLALLCDLRIAAAGTKLGLPEAKYGTVASLGGIYMLSRIVGLGRAFELLYLGETIDAARAEAIGLVNRVVAPDALAAETARIADAIAAQFPAALALTREALLHGLEVDFATAADQETNGAMIAALGGDFERGLAQARERRKQDRPA
jgi:enoyl-CoA hydratase